MKIAAGSPGTRYRTRKTRPDTASIVGTADRKSTRLNSSHITISYAVFCLTKKTRRVYAVLALIDYPSASPRGRDGSPPRTLPPSLFAPPTHCCAAREPMPPLHDPI